MTNGTMLRVAFGEALVELARKNDRVVVLDGDLANATRVDIFADAVAERFLQMGIAEQNMIGVAAGLAACGFVPFAVTFAAFAAHRDLDQVRVVVAQPKLPVVVVGAYSGLLAGRTGKTHLCLEDIAVFRALPNMTVLAPGDAGETRGAVFAAATYGEPVYIRLTRDPSASIGGEARPFTIGPAIRLRDGADVGIISTGVQTVRALAAADELADEGISAAVLHVPTVKPIDTAAIVAIAAEVGALVATEDHSIVGGLGSAVAEVLAEQFPTPLIRVGTRDVYGESAPNEALLEKYGLTPASVANAARDVIARRQTGRRRSRKTMRGGV